MQVILKRLNCEIDGERVSECLFCGVWSWILYEFVSSGNLIL